MTQNIVEYLRSLAIEKLFATAGFNNAWPTWLKKLIHLQQIEQNDRFTIWVIHSKIFFTQLIHRLREVKVTYRVVVQIGKGLCVGI